MRTVDVLTALSDMTFLDDLFEPPEALGLRLAVDSLNHWIDCWEAKVRPLFCRLLCPPPS